MAYFATRKKHPAAWVLSNSWVRVYLRVWTAMHPLVSSLRLSKRHCEIGLVFWAGPAVRYAELADDSVAAILSRDGTV